MDANFEKDLVGYKLYSAREINITEADSIRLTIDDGVHFFYERNLTSDTVRVVKVLDYREADPVDPDLGGVYD